MASLQLRIGAQITRKYAHNLLIDVYSIYLYTFNFYNIQYWKVFLVYNITHWGRVTHICVGNLTIIGSDNGLSPGRRQAIIWSILNQCWIIVNWTLRNKLQWNFNRNSDIFIQENGFENVVCKMASICLGLNELIGLGLVGAQVAPHIVREVGRKIVSRDVNTA